MIIPKFNVEQEDNFIIINIKIPYSKFDDIDYYILGKEFKFYSKPYFLRLTFPHELDDENERDVKFNYNIEQNEISFKIPKKIKGEFFENLEMLTSILTPSKIKDKTIEVLDSKKNYEDDNDDNDDQFFNEAIEEIYENLPRVGHEIQNREDNLNEIEKGIENLNLNQNQNQNQNQNLNLIDSLKNQFFYGFNNLYFDVFKYLQEDILEIIDFKNPDFTSYSQRKKNRIEKENQDFNLEHYMADYALSFEFSHVFEFRPFWIRIQNKQKKSKNKNSQFKIRFSTNEKKIMTNLPNKEYLISNPKEILYSLIEIIFAFSYDNRTNLGEPTVESAWNITKLSGTLSWFDTYSSIKESLISCIRRSLVYPLYRNWNLSMKILEDTKIIFSQGKTQVLKCLLKIKDIFDHHELKWHLSKIYIDDFCVWFQKSSSNQLFQNISQELQKIQIKKSEINWNLEEIEKEVEKQKEENEIENEIGDVD